MNQTIIGIDVSKQNLDLYILPSNESHRITNDSNGHTQLLEIINAHDNALVLMESTGCYHTNATRFLDTNGIKVYVLNPKHVRDYAKSCGQLAKTDKIDACIIAKYGQTHELRQKSYIKESTLKFKTLIERRRQIVRMRMNEKIYSEKYRTLKCDNILDKINQAITFYNEQLIETDCELQQLLQESPELSLIHNKLISVPGIGITTAYEIMADIPELGTLTPRQISSLTGVAPINCDSGNMRGQRHIGGGRFYARQALYMACLSGITYNPVIHEYYTRLRIQNHKPFKVAMVACMRKLIIYLNKICSTPTI